MSRIEQAIKDIKSLHDEVGTRPLAVMSGVPYTTLRDIVSRDFDLNGLRNLIALEKVAAPKRSKRQKT